MDTTASTITAPTADAPALSSKNKVGLALAGLLAINDIASLATLAPSGDSPGPPESVNILSAILGFITVAAVIYTWRTRNRLGSRITAGSRVVSAITALPAFFVSGVPSWLVMLAAVFVVLTVVTVGLVLHRER